MTRRTLIFFARADPSVDPIPAEMAYHFATVAAQAGLKAEVRLAGDAVQATVPDRIAAGATGDELRAKVRAGVEARYKVSL
jgi:hypothetical protein